jgi:splicing factor 45
MSLFGGLPGADKAKTDSRGWAKGSGRFVPTALVNPKTEARKASHDSSPAAVAVPIPEFDAGPSGDPDVEALWAGFTLASSSSAAEEYDPLRPNSYDDVVRARNAEREARGAARQSRIQARARALLANKEEELAEALAMIVGTTSAVAPPVSHDEDTERVYIGLGISPAAVRMMTRMGYRHGQGLGKQDQGIAASLYHRPISSGQAVIEMRPGTHGIAAKRMREEPT